MGRGRRKRGKENEELLLIKTLISAYRVAVIRQWKVSFLFRAELWPYFEAAARQLASRYPELRGYTFEPGISWKHEWYISLRG